MSSLQPSLACTAVLVASLVGPLATGCGSAGRSGKPANPATVRPSVADLPTETHAAVAGHRCGESTRCRCRVESSAEDQAETAPPEGDLRRFEVRVSSSSGKIWVTIDGVQQLYKDAERAEDCYYVDLGPGPHTVRMFAKADEPQAGVGAGLHISEYAVQPGPAWYDSFVFQCGVPGPCDREVLSEWKADVAGDRRNLRDVCGATRVGELRWETGRAPDTIHPEDLLLNFTLSVSPNPPSYPPRDPQCPEK